MHNLRGATAVITGAASGIGRALAMELGSQGTELALADVDEAGLQETMRLLGPAKSRAYATDVGDPSAMDSLAERVEQDFGKASILVNNAGVALFGKFEEISLADMEWLMRINFWGMVHGCRSFLPMLKREREAQIVNMSSIFGLVAPPGQSAYASSKFAVRGFTEALRMELAGSTVGVTCVHPAGVSTPIAEKARIGAHADPEEAAAARKRFARVAQISPAVAARKIVGAILGNKARVLVGMDAYRIDAFQRLMPVRGPEMVVAKMEARRTGDESRKSENAPSEESRGQAAP